MATPAETGLNGSKSIILLPARSTEREGWQNHLKRVWKGSKLAHDQDSVYQKQQWRAAGLPPMEERMVELQQGNEEMT